MLVEYDGLRGDSHEQWSLTRVIVATRNQLWSDSARMEEEGGVLPPILRPSSYTGPGFYTQCFEPGGSAGRLHSARPVGGVDRL